MIWKILISLARLSLVLALFWMLFGRPGKRGSARILSNGRIEFAPDRIALWAYPLSIAYLFCLAVKALISSHGNPWDFFIPAIFVSFALQLLFLFSGVVVVSDDSLEKVYQFRKNRRILWTDIEEIETDKGRVWSSMVTVTGKDGTKIIHSPMLADRPRFLLELKRHCGEELPPDFPREPIDGL